MPAKRNQTKKVHIPIRISRSESRRHFEETLSLNKLTRLTDLQRLLAWSFYESGVKNTSMLVNLKVRQKVVDYQE